jgi:NAD dependent epimerase/dehydratase family enzyme
MKIFVTGGTGFVGSNLVRKLTESGHEVTLLTRSPAKSSPWPQGVSYLEGNPTEPGAWQEKVPHHDGIINLAGASIFGRWTKDVKKSIRESRLLTTQNLVHALSKRPSKTAFLFSTSAVGYYGFCDDEELDESSPPG